MVTNNDYQCKYAHENLFAIRYAPLCVHDISKMLEIEPYSPKKAGTTLPI